MQRLGRGRFVNSYFKERFWRSPTLGAYGGRGTPGYGDVWTRVAIDADTKLSTPGWSVSGPLRLSPRRHSSYRVGAERRGEPLGDAPTQSRQPRCTPRS